MKNANVTIEETSIDDLKSRIRSVLKENNSVDVVSGSSLEAMEQHPQSSVRGMNLVEFQKLMKSTKELWNIADIDIVKASDMRDDSILSNEQSNSVESPEVSRPKFKK